MYSYVVDAIEICILRIAELCFQSLKDRPRAAAFSMTLGHRSFSIFQPLPISVCKIAAALEVYCATETQVKFGVKLILELCVHMHVHVCMCVCACCSYVCVHSCVHVRECVCMHTWCVCGIAAFYC